MKNKDILPIGSTVIANKNMFMSPESFNPGSQYLTKNKTYTIVGTPKYYDYPIEIIDDQKHRHSCATSSFK